MEAQSTDTKTFQLTGHGQLLGELIYENLFLLKADIKLPGHELLKIRPVGIFGTSITISKNGTEVATLKINWKGQVVFVFSDATEYVLKPTGLFHNKYVLENQEQEILMQMDPKFNWRKFHYNYSIAYDRKPQDILLVLLAVYAANYLMATMSGML